MKVTPLDSALNSECFFVTRPNIAFAFSMGITAKKKKIGHARRDLTKYSKMAKKIFLTAHTILIFMTGLADQRCSEFFSASKETI
jgi:hypothetical protein